MELVKKEDVIKDNSGKWGKDSRYKRCHKCGSPNVDLTLTEIVRITTKYEKRYLCNDCDKIKG